MSEVATVIPRHGGEIARVRITPTGMSRSERRALAWLRNWPAVGAVGALIVILSLGARIPPLELIPPLIVCYLVGIAATRLATRRLRRGIVRFEVVSIDRRTPSVDR